MAISITKIPFFQPMDRDRDYSSALNKVLWALYDVGIDGVLSSPFATKCYHVHENGLNQAGKKKFDILNPSRNHSFLGYSGYLISKVTILFGLIYYRKFTSMALVMGLAIKYYVRSSEVYYSSNVRLSEPRRNPEHRPQISIEERQKNLLLWMQKWMCDSYFHLFALGMTEASIIPEEVSQEVFVRVFIGEEFAHYPKSFLMQLPFFSALMGSGMSDMTEEGIRLTLAFPYRHEDLATLQKRLASSNASEWGNLEAYDFLCVGMRRDRAASVEKIGAVQAAILDHKLEAMNPYLQYHSNRSLQTGPGVKAGAYSLEFLPSIEQIDKLEAIQEVGPRVQGTVECLLFILQGQHYSKAQRHFFCNKVIDGLITFLHYKRDPEIDILRLVISVIEQCQGLENHITVLNLTDNVKFSSGLLPKLLEMLPNLYWLQISLFFEEFREADLGNGHQELRLLSISGQKLCSEEEGRIRERFPNIDVLETG